MKTIIAGSRTVGSTSVVEEACNYCGWEITQVVSGCARGVDTLGEIWAAAHNLPVERHPANWDKHGKKAGYLRNIEMAECSEALIAVWDGESRGTSHMIVAAQRLGLKVYIHRSDFWG
jgi:hypothetical protein